MSSTLSLRGGSIQRRGNDLEPSCFCDPWRRRSDYHATGNARGGVISTDYTDADLAADMNGLTFQERQAIEEDVHGVMEMIEETEEFVTQKIDEMKEALQKLSARRRAAWDKASFLRPSFKEGPAYYIMCLRARRFHVQEGAELLASHFQSKLELFGDGLLAHHITWQDLTPREQTMLLSGMNRIIPNLEKTGRGVAYSRLNQWDVVDNFKSMTRCFWYQHQIILDNPQMQRKGIVAIGDLRGKWMSTPLQIIQYLSSLKGASTAYHESSFHIIYDDPSLDTMIRALRRIFPKDKHLRYRLHCGSSIEIEYVLRSFGIDLSGKILGLGGGAHPFSSEATLQDFLQRQQAEEERRLSEAPYKLPTSRTALFPNLQDIIMGRNKLVAESWPGNIAYRKLIEHYSYRYATVQSADRLDKTLVALDFMHTLQSEYGARFLARKDTVWEVIDDVEAQKKVSHGLRFVARDRARQLK